MTASQKIEAIIKHLNINAKLFSEELGYDRPQIIYDVLKGKTKSISESLATKISSVYPEVNRFWLLTGEGEMLNSGVKGNFEDTQKAVLIPLVNIDSVGGVHSENLTLASEQYVERLIPFPDARHGDVAIMQSGNSMAPTIPAGAIMQIRKVEGWREYFGYGNDFVLWLDDDRRITKQVLKYEPDAANYVTCHSYNPESADEELPKSMIKEVWKVVNVLINKGW